MRNYGYLLKKHAELWALFWENVTKNWQEEQRICIRCLTISLRFEEISLHCRNMDIFRQFCGSMGSVFSDIGRIMGHKVEPEWLKLGLVKSASIHLMWVCGLMHI